MITPRALDWDDELLDATRRSQRARLNVFRPSEVAVVMGRSSRPEVELNVQAIEIDGVPLLKRRGGGCSVVLDPGNVIVSVGLALPGFGGIPLAFKKISDWTISALASLGVTGVEQKGVSDFVLGDRKVGGACIFRTKDLLYYTTTLLFRPDLDLVERYLRHPPREPAYRAGRDHRAFMGGIAESAAANEIEAFAQLLERSLRDSITKLECSFSSREIHLNSSTEVFA